MLKDIVRLSSWDALGPLLLVDKFKKIVKDGANTFFWHDLWYQDSTLKSRFQGLFQRADFQNFTVQQVIQRYELKGKTIRNGWFFALPSSETNDLII